MNYEKNIRETQSSIIEIVKNTFNNKCNQCGKSGNILHHPKYEKGMKLKDIELLCFSCHRLKHAKYMLRVDHATNILNVFKKDTTKDLSMGDISEELNISKPLCLIYIRKLFKEGKISKVSNGYIHFYKIVL